MSVPVIDVDIEEHCPVVSQDIEYGGTRDVEFFELLVHGQYTPSSAPTVPTKAPAIYPNQKFLFTYITCSLPYSYTQYCTNSSDIPKADCVHTLLVPLHSPPHSPRPS